MTDALTRGERAVVAELARDGQTNRVIAERLFVAEQTIKFHLANACRKVSARTRVELALWWIRRGQYTPEPAPNTRQSRRETPLRRRRHECDRCGAVELLWAAESTYPHECGGEWQPVRRRRAT